MSLRVLQERIDNFANVRQHEPVYRTWLDHVRKWIDQGDWKTYQGSIMKDVRNSIRGLLLAGGLNNRSIAINKKSAIDDLIPIFIPPELTTSTFKTHFSCNAPQHSQPGHENDQNTHFKIRKIPFLLMNGKDGVNGSTQNMLDNFVTTYSLSIYSSQAKTPLPQSRQSRQTHMSSLCPQYASPLNRTPPSTSHCPPIVL